MKEVVISDLMSKEEIVYHQYAYIIYIQIFHIRIGFFCNFSIHAGAQLDRLFRELEIECSDLWPIHIPFTKGQCSWRYFKTTRKKIKVWPAILFKVSDFWLSSPLITTPQWSSRLHCTRISKLNKQLEKNLSTHIIFFAQFLFNTVLCF